MQPTPRDRREAASASETAIRVGVAGWDYPDWEGVVYPSRVPGGFDRLAFVARFVDAVEINSTFYRPASPRTAAGWVRRVRERSRFRFTAKAHRAFTHDPGRDAETEDRSLEGLRPLAESGLLGAVLLQFPQSFHRSPAAFERLARLADRFRDWPAAVEVRHASWDDDEAAERVRGMGLAWCVVDQPAVGRLTAPRRPRVTSRLAYLRLHGRNAAEWFREGAGRDARYDYLYDGEEIRGLAGTAEALAARADEVYVIANNHFRGQALANALQLRHRLVGARSGAPAGLIAAYPALAEVADPFSDRLF